jgi:hypothetical protein
MSHVARTLAEGVLGRDGRGPFVCVWGGWGVGGTQACCAARGSFYIIWPHPRTLALTPARPPSPSPDANTPPPPQGYYFVTFHG